MTGIEQIAEERKRQIEEEGYSSGHDDEHFHGELAAAAYCYSLVASIQIAHKCKTTPYNVPDPHAEEGEAQFMHTAPNWPWNIEDWKPSNNPKRNIEKAGALLAAQWDVLDRWEKEQQEDAEIDRLDRQESKD